MTDKTITPSESDTTGQPAALDHLKRAYAAGTMIKLLPGGDQVVVTELGAHEHGIVVR